MRSSVTPSSSGRRDPSGSGRVAALGGAGLVLVLTLGSACTTPPSNLPSNLQDPEALALNGSNLFITSSDTDELRVLTLNPSTLVEAYVPAPNPLYVLSIPVVAHPFAMVTDTDGINSGAFIFVLGSEDNRLGIVDATGMVELQELALPSTPRSVAARTVLAADGGSAGARVYIGLSTGIQGSIAVVDVPALSALPAPGLEVNTTYADLGTADPAGLALSPDGTTLAIADQLADEANPDPSQRRGGVIFLDVHDPTAAVAGGLSRVMVGGPALRLNFSPESFQFPTDGGTFIPPGQFLYVVLSNSGCGLGQPCGGVQIVIDGKVPESSPGVPWRPMVIPGQATDVAAGAGPLLNLPSTAGLGGPINVPLLLTIPSTDGHVYFADGIEGRIFNVDDQQPSVIAPVVHLDPNGAPLTFPDAGLAPNGTDIAFPDGGYDLTGPTDIQLALGGVQAGTIQVQYLGLLPVLSARAAAVDGGVLTDSEADFQRLGVETGDWVVFISHNASCFLADVTAVGSLDGGLAPNQLELSPGLENASCANDPDLTYQVEAGPTSAQPYVVVGSVAGFLGRTQANTLFSTGADYFYRPPGYNPAVPGLEFQMGTGATPLPDGGSPQAGEAWEFEVDSAVLPMEILGGLNGLIPGPAIWVDGLVAYFVGYPGSNVTSEVIQFFPATVVYDTDTNITEWE